uniref:Phasin family protein n=1 Tax=candidate division WOR-3 bacterium TaxID=2052148 RepID=A0A7C4XES0_UNCW3
MKGRIRNGILAGLGMVSLSRKKFLKVYQDLIKEGEKARDESEFLKQKWQRLDSWAKEFENLTLKLIERANLATRGQLEKLNEKVDRVIKELKSR